MKNFVAFIPAWLLTLFIAGQLKYPAAKQVNQADDYFGTTVKDPYRWLEEDNNETKKEGTEVEKKGTQDFLSKIPFRHLKMDFKD